MHTNNSSHHRRGRGGRPPRQGNYPHKLAPVFHRDMDRQQFAKAMLLIAFHHHTQENRGQIITVEEGACDAAAET